MITWITGNRGAGKSTLLQKIRRHGDVILDGHSLRQVWPDLGFSKKDRWEQNLRTARLAKLLADQGHNVLVATICPFKKLREEVNHITDCRFIYLTGGMGKECPYEYEV